MNAIKQVRTYLQTNSDSPSALILTRLAAALGEESEFALGQLYELNAEAFDLAIELMKDWRLDRYYAARIKLFDVVLDGIPEYRGSRSDSEEREPEISSALASQH